MSDHKALPATTDVRASFSSPLRGCCPQAWAWGFGWRLEAGGNLSLAFHAPQSFPGVQGRCQKGEAWGAM